MTDAESYFQANTVSRDFFALVCGPLMGRGAGREVFQNLLDPSTVIKIESGSRSFQNVMEWSVWERVQSAKGVHQWFCPCVSISACGTVLIQKKAADLREKELPKEVPAYLTDLKLDNWGSFDGRPVVRDYGYHLLLENGMTKRMKKADWVVR